MKHFVTSYNRRILLPIGLLVIVLALVGTVKITYAAWEEPQAEPPDDNMFAPLDVSDNNQAKRGRLLLDPLYNPLGAIPEIDYPLEVRGPRDVYINKLEIVAEGDLSVDTDTLVVDGTGHMVGMGTGSPDELLDIRGYGATLGSDSQLISGNALVVTDVGKYGAYGLSQGDSIASVLGESDSGSGIYGLHTAGGTGIMAQSESASAVRGTVSAAAGSPVAAGIYAQAQGLGSWAGYFAQRVYGTQEVVGSTFLPTALPYSSIPYSVGWKTQDIAQSYVPAFSSIAFDGRYLWINNYTAYWSQAPYIHKIDAYTGEQVEAFKVSGAEHAYNSPGMGTMDYAGGYIWMANPYKDNEGIYRIDPHSQDYDTTLYSVGTHDADGDGNTDDGESDGPFDFIYDDITYPDNTFVWVVSDYEDNAAASRYYITRLQPAADEYGFCSDPSQLTQAGCTGTWYDDLSELDFSGATCPVCVNCTGTTTTEPCSVPGYYTEAECTNPSVGGAWDPDANFGYAELRYPSGITFDGTKIWVSFAGGGAYASGLVSFDAADPVNTATTHCAGPNRNLQTIDWGSGMLWAGDKQRENEVVRLFAIDPAADPLYLGIDDYGSFGSELGSGTISILAYDEKSAGGPYLWVINPFHFAKFSINPVTKTLAPAHVYSLYNSGYNFAFAENEAGERTVWTTHGNVGGIIEHLVDTSVALPGNSPYAPYYQRAFLPVGASVGGMVFDSTYIWTADRNTNKLSKFNIADGSKMGDYDAGWYPLGIVYDGRYIWTVNSDEYGYKPNTNDLTKFDPVNGEIVDEYKITNYNGEMDIARGGYIDMRFDGQYIWITFPDSDEIAVFDPDTIDTSGVTFYDDTDHGIDNPYRLVYDGESMWVSHIDNKISRVQSDGTNAFTRTFDIIDGGVAYNISALEFDGTYLWIGTKFMDTQGRSVYKYDPAGDVIVDEFTVYNDSGICLAGERQYQYCRSDADCPSSTCDAKGSRVTDILFDGTHVWIKHGGRNDDAGSIECNDGIDNDGVGHCDISPYAVCTSDAECTPGTCDFTDQDDDRGGWCENTFDLHEGSRCNDDQDNDQDGTCDHDGCNGLPADLDCTDEFSDAEGNPECSDGWDNNGDGLCDYDGAVGAPGCSGKPDPGCSSASDASEAIPSTHSAHLTRIIPATGAVVESLYYDRYTQVSNHLVYDGSKIWIGDGSTTSRETVHSYYAGTGLRTDLSDTVVRQGSFPGTAQIGLASYHGSLTVDTALEVIGDLVVTTNIWGGTADDVKAFGTACDDGQFIKGIDTTSGQSQCRPL